MWLLENLSDIYDLLSLDNVVLDVPKVSCISFVVWKLQTNAWMT